MVKGASMTGEASIEDWQLLRRFTEHNSQEAFAALTARYLNLVYSVCRRELADDEAAEDVTQAVFLILARKAPGLGRNVVLSGWLFQTARFAARNARLQAQRRAAYEQKAAEAMGEQTQGREDAAWSEIEPVLNDALAALRERDRECVLLRFFQGLSFAEAGAALGLSEEAARKRVGRALEKMRAFLGKEGVLVPTAALAVLLPAHTAKAVPVSVAVAVARLTPVTAPTATALLAKGTLQAMRIANLRTAVVATAVMMLGGLAYTVTRTTTEKPPQQHRVSAMPLNAPASPNYKAMPPFLLKAIYADDAALKTAHMVYKEVGEQHMPITRPIDHPRAIQFQELRWRSKIDTSSATDGRFSIETVTDYPGRPSQETRQIYNGVDKMTIFGQGKEVQFKANVPQDMTINRLTSVAPGPCFAIGRGLSLLDKPHLSGSLASPVLTGTYDGDTYRATLDPQHDYLATLILRYNSGALASQWTLGKPFHIPGGTWIATRSTYVTMFPDGNGDHSTYSVLLSKGWKSSASSFDYGWQVPGKEIVDLRLNKPAIFDSRALIEASGGRPLTSASLLEFSRRSLAFQTKRALENETLARQHNTSQALRPRVITMLSSIIVITMAFMLCRRGDQKTRNKVV